MSPADKPRFLALLKGVHSFYRADLTEFGYGVWERALARYSIEQITKAFDQHCADPKAGSFMPKPADLVRVLDGTHEDRALVAWGKVLEAAQRVGQYQSVAFDDPAIHAAIVDMGGWQQVCGSTMDELPFLQRRFCDLHGSYTRRGAYDYPRWLPGMTEIQNTGRGHQRPAPVLIGNDERARAVIAGGADGAKTQMRSLGAEALKALTQ